MPNGIPETSCWPETGAGIAVKWHHSGRHRNDRRRRISVSKGPGLLVRRRIQIVLGLLHGIRLMERLLRLLLRLLLMLLESAYASLGTA